MPERLQLASGPSTEDFASLFSFGIAIIQRLASGCFLVNLPVLISRNVVSRNLVDNDMDSSELAITYDFHGKSTLLCPSTPVLRGWMTLLRVSQFFTV